MTAPGTPPEAEPPRGATPVGPAAGGPAAVADRSHRPAPPVRERGWFEIRWRQFRRAPRPVVRAVASSLSVATALGVLFLAYDIALDRGAALPGGDLRLLVLAVYVVVVLASGAFVTWLVVPLPSAGGARRSTRTPWSAALGLFAAGPIAYLVLVVLHELVKPLFG